MARCTREDIRINTFMLDATGYLQHFIERLTELNGGRAFFTTPETLGDYVLVDFVEQKRAMAPGRHGRPDAPPEGPRPGPASRSWPRKHHGFPVAPLRIGGQPVE